MAEYPGIPGSTIVGVYETGTVYRLPDGREFFQESFNIAQPIQCGTGPNQILCTEAGLGKLLPTTNTQVPLALLDVQTQAYAQVVGPLGDAALSNLGAYQLARVSPTLASLQLSQYAGLPVTQTIGVGTPLQAQIQQELQTNTQQLLDMGIKTGTYDSLQDPELAAYKRYLNAIDTSAALAPLVQSQLEKSVGLLDSLGFTTSIPTFSPNTNFSFPTFSPTPTMSSGPVPIQSTGGGVIDTISGVLGGVLDGVGAIGGTILGAATQPGVLDLVRALSNAGVIRGSVGQAFMQTNPISAASVGVMGGPMPTTNVLQSLLQALAGGSSVGDGSMTGNMLSGLENLLGVNQGCGSRTLRVPMAQAMGLYKQGCNRQYIPRRILVDGPDGVPVVLYNAGQATIGSRETSVAKSIARRHGLKLCSKSSGGRRSYRRRPR